MRFWLNYLPIQNFEKIFSSKSSVDICSTSLVFALDLRGGDTNATAHVQQHAPFRLPCATAQPNRPILNIRKKIPILLVAKVKSRT